MLAASRTDEERARIAAKVVELELERAALVEEIDALEHARALVRAPKVKQ